MELVLRWFSFNSISYYSSLTRCFIFGRGFVANSPTVMMMGTGRTLSGARKEE